MATPEPHNTEFEEMIFATRPESVLDIGCGEGGFIRRATERGICAAGVDLNAERDALLLNARATGCTKAGAIFVVVRF